jgi:hypothetical protein
MKSVPRYLINKVKNSHSQHLNVNCRKILLKMTIFHIKQLFCIEVQNSVIFSVFFSIVNIYILDVCTFLLIDMTQGTLFMLYVKL